MLVFFGRTGRSFANGIVILRAVRRKPGASYAPELPRRLSENVALPVQSRRVRRLRVRSDSVPRTVVPDTVPAMTAFAAAGALATNVPPKCPCLIRSGGNPHAWTDNRLRFGQRS